MTAVLVALLAAARGIARHRTDLKAELVLGHQVQTPKAFRQLLQLIRTIGLRTAATIE